MCRRSIHKTINYLFRMEMILMNGHFALNDTWFTCILCNRMDQWHLMQQPCSRFHWLIYIRNYNRTLYIGYVHASSFVKRSVFDNNNILHDWQLNIIAIQTKTIHYRSLSIAVQVFMFSFIFRYGLRVHLNPSWQGVLSQTSVHIAHHSDMSYCPRPFCSNFVCMNHH